MQKVIIPLNAFNRMEVLEKGQASFIKLIAESGAYGIEIRRELFSNQDPTLVSMKQEMEQHQLFTVYSAPIELWKEDHQLNEQELTTIFQEGKQLGAKWIKVSLGHFDKSQSSVSNLHSFLRQHPEIQLFVENDQTLHGGNITNLQSFLKAPPKRMLRLK